MVEQATSFTDRIESARGRIDDEIGRVQKQIQARRKQIEKQINTGRKQIEKQINTGRKSFEKQLTSSRKSFEKQLTSSRKSFEKQTRKQVKDLRQSPVVQEVERIGGEVNRQLEGVFDRLLGVLQIASKNDVDRIDRKLTKLNKRLKDMERSRKTNGHTPAQAAPGS